MGSSDGGSCQCTNSVEKLVGLQKLELGPAYEPYKSGQVRIQRVFRQYERIPALFIPTCCGERPFSILSYYPTVHFALLGIWWVLSAILFILYWRKRHDFPLKFRSPRTIIVLWSVLSTAVTLVSVNAAAGWTCTCHFELILLQILLPIITSYFPIKAAQLAFLYNWNRAKLHKKVMDVKTFHRFKWIMSDRPFLSCALFLLVVGITIHMLEMTAITDIYSPTKNSIYSFRTFWWKIPEQYRQPTGANGTRGSLCTCWDLSLVLAGDTTAAALNTTSEALLSACTSAYITDCLSDAECATACPATSLNGQLSSACEKWFIEYFSTGICGYPAFFPNLSTVLFCFGVYRPVMYFFFALYMIILLAGLILALSVVRMDDQMYMRREVLQAFVMGAPSTSFVFAESLSVEFKQAIVELLPYYPLDMVLCYFIVFSVLATNIAVPIALAYYHARVPQSSRTKELGQTNEAGKVHIFTALSGLPSEGELLFALRNEAAGECYATFAWKEFTVENVKFLQAVKELIDEAKDISLQSSAWRARSVYELYVQEGSPFEINISAVNRAAVRVAVTGETNQHKRIAKPVLTISAPHLSIMGIHTEPQTPGSMNETVSSVNTDEENVGLVMPLCSTLELREWFAPAVDEIRSLILKDSWPRFQSSTYYEQFVQLYIQQQVFDEVIRSLHPQLSGSDDSAPRKRQSSILLRESSVGVISK